MISFTPFDPIFLTLGPLQFRYYGLMYVIAFFLCYFYLKFLRKKKVVTMSNQEMWDMLFWGVLGVVVGGRVGYILFYNLWYFIENPMKVFAVWEGGMSFHGGLIGIILFEYIYCKIKKLPFFKIGDYMVIPLSIGVACAKFGNFINGELYGRSLETTFSVPWGMYFERAGNDTLRHPSQLYEMSKNIVIFFVLIGILKKFPKYKEGTLLFMFLFLYGVFRFFIEFVREPDPQLGLFFGWMSMGQILCSIMIIVGVGGFYFLYRKK